MDSQQCTLHFGAKTLLTMDNSLNCGLWTPFHGTKVHFLSLPWTVNKKKILFCFVGFFLLFFFFFCFIFNSTYNFVKQSFCTSFIYYNFLKKSVIELCFLVFSSFKNPWTNFNSNSVTKDNIFLSFYLTAFSLLSLWKTSDHSWLCLRWTLCQPWTKCRVHMGVHGRESPL